MTIDALRMLKEAGMDAINITPTPTDILEFAYKEARRQGIYYPYIGNIPGHPFENTYCPYCGTLLIERVGYRITRWEIKGKNCPHCKKEVHLTP